MVGAAGRAVVLRATAQPLIEFFDSRILGFFDSYSPLIPTHPKPFYSTRDLQGTEVAKLNECISGLLGRHGKSGAAPGEYEIVAEIIRKVQWLAYEEGLDTDLEPETIIWASAYALARVLAAPLKVVTCGARTTLGVMGPRVGYEIPLLLDDHLIEVSGRCPDGSLSEWYVRVLTDATMEWSRDAFPFLVTADLEIAFWGRLLPDSTKQAWRTAHDRSGQAVIRRLGLEAPLLVIEERWVELEGMLGSSFGNSD